MTGSRELPIGRKGQRKIKFQQRYSTTGEITCQGSSSKMKLAGTNDDEEAFKGDGATVGLTMEFFFFFLQ